MKKLLITAAAAALLAIYAGEDEQKAEYRTTLKRGETVWDVCTRVATPKDNINEMVYEALKASGIKDSSKLQAGQELIIPVTLRE